MDVELVMDRLMRWAEEHPHVQPEPPCPPLVVSQPGRSGFAWLWWREDAPSDGLSPWYEVEIYSPSSSPAIVSSRW